MEADRRLPRQGGEEGTPGPPRPETPELAAVLRRFGSLRLEGNTDSLISEVRRGSGHG